MKTAATMLLIIAGSAGATVFYMTHMTSVNATESVQATAKADKAAAHPAAPIFVALEPFTVTLRNDYGSRILYAAITLRVSDEASRQLLTNYMPEVRDRILLALAGQDPRRVQAPATRLELAQTLTQALEAPYQPQPTQPKITRVLFTAFVVQ